MLKKIISIIMICIMTVTIAGCSKNNSGAPADNNKPSSQKRDIMSEFDSLMERNPNLGMIIEFINQNISESTKEEASDMLGRLETAQKDYLGALEDKYSEGSIQDKIDKIYKPGTDLNNLEGVNDEELKKLLKETKDLGYKVETAEGMYYPILDYDSYKKYKENVADDFADYIDIMSTESDEASVKDAELTIGWDKILNRALAQEKFIEKYPDSKRSNEVKSLYKNYTSFIFLGTNNSPLFDYDTHTMDNNAKSAYKSAADKKSNSKLLGKLKDFLKIAEKNNYKLTNEVDDFRHAALSSL